MTLKLVSSEGDLVEVTRQFFERRPEIVFTRAKYVAVVFTRNGGGNFPLIGAYFNGGEWIPTAWLADGRFGSVNEHLHETPLDLMIEMNTKA